MKRHELRLSLALMKQSFRRSVDPIIGVLSPMIHDRKKLDIYSHQDLLRYCSEFVDLGVYFSVDSDQPVADVSHLIYLSYLGSCGVVYHDRIHGPVGIALLRLLKEMCCAWDFGVVNNECWIHSTCSLAVLSKGDWLI